MKEVLLVTIGFSPNIGGIETHFNDLIVALKKRGWRTTVLTYYPLTTSLSTKFYEKKDDYLKIVRLPIFRGFFYRLVKKPIIEFVYLTPGLFFGLPILLLFRGSNYKIIHSHGLVAGFVSVFWGRIFRKKVITTTHSIYSFPQEGFYRRFAKWIFSGSDRVLTLSKQSADEIINLGVDKNKVNVFTYWVDLRIFKPIPRAKRIINMEKKFIVFCASRLVPEKGIAELLEAASTWNKKIYLLIASDGPLRDVVISYTKKFKNIIYIGKLPANDLVPYYSAADLYIIPSTHEEGFGRVILESLACGTPVIGSNRGAIPEAMNETVGRLIESSPKNIKKAVEFLYKNTTELEGMSKNARSFAVKRYSEKNVEDIIRNYE